MAPENILGEAREIIKKAYWREAITYRNTAPHEYAGIDQNRHIEKEMYRLAELIKEYGVVEYFYGHPDKYLHVDGLKYFGWSRKTGFWCINCSPADKYYGPRGARHKE